MEVHNEKIFNPDGLPFGPLTSCHFYGFLRMPIGSDDIEALVREAQVKNAGQILWTFRFMSIFKTACVALCIHECWEVQRELEFTMDVSLKRRLQWKVGAIRRAVLFGHGYQPWADTFFTHWFNLPCPACLNTAQLSDPGLSNTERCFIYKISEVFSTCTTKIHMFTVDFLEANFHNLFTNRKNVLILM